MSTTITPNMLLTVPVVGVEPGPDWASDINNCMTLIDQHDHTPGFGVQLTAASINVNTTFPMNNNQITGVAAAVFTAQTSFATNLALYVIANDIYYRDGAGNQVRITQSGSVTGSAGTITGLPSGTASATYTAINQTFTFQSATNTAANLDAGSLLMRNLSPNSTFALTLSPPAALGSNYTITLPTLPVSTKIVTMDSTGALAANYVVDGTTITISGNTIGVFAGGIGTTQLATNAVTTVKITDANVTRVKLAAVGQQISSSCGTFTNTNGTRTNVTNLSVSLTTSGRPVVLMLIGSGGATDQSNITFTNDAEVSFLRDGTIININPFSTTGTAGAIPGSSVQFLDVIGAGTYTYTVQARKVLGTSMSVVNIRLAAYEL